LSIEDIENKGEIFEYRTRTRTIYRLKDYIFKTNFLSIMLVQN